MKNKKDRQIKIAHFIGYFTIIFCQLVSLYNCSGIMHQEIMPEEVKNLK